MGKRRRRRHVPGITPRRYKEGFCLAGIIGDCASSNENVTESFNENVTENIRNTLIEISSTNAGVIEGTQTINISDLKCRTLRISGITQKNISKVNFSNLSDVMTEERLQSMLTSAVKQTAETDQDVNAAFMSGATDNSDATITKNRNINRVVSNYKLSDFRANLAELSGKQLINIANNEVDTDCDISNLSQTLELDVLAANIGESLTKSFADVVLDAESEQDSKTSQDNEAGGIGDVISAFFSGLSGLLGGWALYLIALIVVVIVLVFVGPWAVRKMVKG